MRTIGDTGDSRNGRLVWIIVAMAVAGLAVGTLQFGLSGRSVSEARQRAEIQTRQDLCWIARYLENQRQPGGALANVKDEEAIVTGLRQGWLADMRENNAKIWDADATGQAVDGWGTPIRIDVSGTQTIVVRSAGEDRKWGTADDLSMECVAN